jgi:serine/threonine protein kinase
MSRVAPELFAKSVIAAGLSSADEIKQLWAALPSGTRPKHGDAFARLLIERGLLTEFQAQTLLTGSSLPLVLGDYVLLDKIGAGGMGQVFKAQHRHMKRAVAIKLLSAALIKDEAAVKRFQREVEAAAKLSHPHIVQAHDASLQRGVWYLVMEYVAGSDLAGIVRQEGPLPLRRALRCLRQTAEGLAYAHRQGIVHRDIKPANLLLDVDENVKILDMGLARLEASAARQDDLTGTGQIMGTIDYMAPEQALNTKHADARADIYSLGITLWFLLTGRAAYAGDTVMEKLLAHREQPIPSLAAICPGVSDALDLVFQRMIAKKPAERYQTMQEVIAALDACPLLPEPEVTMQFSPSAITAAATPRAAQAPAASGPRASGWASLMTVPRSVANNVQVPETIVTTSASGDTSPSAQLDVSSIQVSVSSLGARNATQGRIAWRDWRVVSSAALMLVLLVVGGGYFAFRGNNERPQAPNPQSGQTNSPQPELSASANPAPEKTSNLQSIQFTPPQMKTGSIEGPWSYEHGSLKSPFTPYSQFRLPGKAPTHYRWKFDLTREAGNGALVIGLPVESTVLVVTLDDGPLHQCSFGERTKVLPTRVIKTTEFAGFLPHKTMRVECLVSPAEVRVLVNNEEVLKHNGSVQGFAAPARWKLDDYGSGFLATSLTQFSFSVMAREDLSATQK